MGHQPGDRVVGDERGHLGRRVLAFGPEPMRRPVQRAEEGAGADGCIGRPQRTTPNAAGNQRAYAALVPIALGDNAGAKTRRQGIDREVRGRALDLVEQAQHVRDGHRLEPAGERAAVARGRGQRVEQAIERPVLAEEENLFLAAEVVIQIAGRQVRGHGDVAHPGGGEAARPEDARRRAHDFDTAGFRTN